MPKTPPSPDWTRVARLLLTSRRLDEFEERELAPAGKVPYQFSAKGHELSQILLALQLTHLHDAATVYYRSRPFMLAAGLTVREALAAGMAKSGSPSEGRDVGVVFSMKPESHREETKDAQVDLNLCEVKDDLCGLPIFAVKRNLTVLPSSGDVGAQYTPAAGWAQAIQYHREVLKDEEWHRAIAEEAFTDLDAPLARLAVPDVPMPYNMTLMNAVVPQAADIAEKIQSMLAF